MSPTESMQDSSLLSFSLGPVQPFIAGARTVRDLWSGSYLLSWLTFQATNPIRHAHGDLLFPALDGNPLLKLEQGTRPEPDQLLTPCLPNRFTALVGAGEADTLATECAKGCRRAWEEICAAVHRVLTAEVTKKRLPHAANWDRLWPQQVNSFFEIRTAVLPCKDADAAALMRLLGGLPTGEGDEARLYMGRMELLGRLAESLRSVRHVPSYAAEGDVPQKCTLLGTYEQMGPAPLRESRAFWDAFADQVRPRGTHTRKNERLCALSLVKRFAWTAFFVDRLGLEPEDLRFDDTATEAARLWLRDDKYSEPIQPDTIRKKCKDWSGQWLHWVAPNQDESESKVPDEVWKSIQRKKNRHPEPVPTYYAILMIDGDDMGKWLRGEKGVSLGPKMHRNLSRALTRFALEQALKIVPEYDGTLIYAGGDDVLALLPTRPALACARDLNERYQANWTAHVPASGPDGHATVSAGLAIVHAKEDLRFALNAARGAEALAKAAGKDALTVRVCRRSGEHSSATLPWALVPQLEALVEQFAGDISDRWTYRLRAALPTLAGPGVPPEAFTAETTRLLNRLEAEGRRRDEHRKAVLAFHKDYVATMQTAKRRPGKDETQNRRETLAGFVTLCQAASFLARGRDE